MYFQDFSRWLRSGTPSMHHLSLPLWGVGQEVVDREVGSKHTPMAIEVSLELILY